LIVARPRSAQPLLYRRPVLQRICPRLASVGFVVSATIAVPVAAALIAAAVSVATTLLTKLWLDRRAHREQLQVDYEYEQRKALLGLIGCYHGRLVDHATSWHYRMENIYANVGRGWLDVSGQYSRPDYFFRSTLYRFFALEAHAQLFENEQIFIDARVVDPSDLDFVKFVKALHWVMTDAALFEGLAYESFEGQDHLTSDRLRTLCEAFLDEGQVPSFRTFEMRLRSEDAAEGKSELGRVFMFFDGISPHEERFRWDRLICLHLLTMAFLRGFGYDWERPSDADLKNAINHIKHPEIARNLAAWLPRLGLGEHEALRDVRALLQRSAGASPAASRA
jgi:hypothetical protein